MRRLSALNLIPSERGTRPYPRCRDGCTFAYAHGENLKRSRCGSCRGGLYPQYLLPIAGREPVEVDEFDLLRERLLVNFTYNTARAYWGDLEDFRRWCQFGTPQIDPLTVEPHDVSSYVDHLRQIDYSPNTIARRLTTLRAFFDLRDAGVPNPARSVASVRRRTVR
jgi:hypothetical protein